MSMIYVTGISGSGKSSVCKELARRGYEAYDTDEGLSAWYENATGLAVARPLGAIGRTTNWYAEHSWRFVRERIEAIAARTAGKTAFICGSAANEIEVWDLFAIVIYLHIDEGTLRHRLATRSGNGFGAEQHELNAILGWYKAGTLRADYQRYGAVIIDATQSLETVVDAVVAEMEKQRHVGN
jgi:adenylate kinase family enzyme